MIVLKLNGEQYKIYKSLKITEGRFKKSLEFAVSMISFEYRNWMGNFEPFLCSQLAQLKGIEIVSVRFVTPKPEGDEEIVY